MKWLGALVLLGAGSGCLAPAVYRTAHVLEPGETDLGLDVSFQSVETSSYTSDRGTVLYPKMETAYLVLLPELSWHYGVAADFEVGGRLALGASMGEVDAKLRLVGSRASSLHVALQPALGGRVRTGSVYGGDSSSMRGFHATLPLLVTYDITSRWSLTSSLFGQYTSYRDWSDNEPDIVGDVAYAGGALSVRLRLGSTFYLMPMVEMQRSVWRRRLIGNEPTVTLVVAGIGVGWQGPGGAR